MKIFAVGMNYTQHNLAMGRSCEKPHQPVIFIKPDSALLHNSKPFFVPDFMGKIEYEAEVVVRICRLGKSIPQRFAHRYYDAVTVGIDFTAREIQQQLKAKGLPWELSKAFDGSAVIGQWVEKEKLPNIQDLHFGLDIDDCAAQRGHTADMLFAVDELIAYISRYFTLKTGDLLFTGTPTGVGKVQPNNHLTGYLENEKVLDFYCR